MRVESTPGISSRILTILSHGTSLDQMVVRVHAVEQEVGQRVLATP